VTRTRIVRVLDWLALLLVVAAVAIAVTGGAILRAGGVRITARSPDRPLVAALVVVILRIGLDRRSRPFPMAAVRFRQARARLYDERADEHAAASGSWWRRSWMPAAGIGAFGVALLLPQLRRMDSVPDLGDPLFSIWRFAWVFQKLLGDPRPLFSPNIFYPHQLTLTYSDSMLLPSLTTAPLLALGVHPVTTYNAVLVASFIVSGFAMYLLVERLTGSRVAGFVSALLFGFHPYRFEHYSHFELQMTYCMPLALLALHRFVAFARFRDAIAAALLAAGQLYCSMYYAVFFSIVASVVFVQTAWLTRAPLRRLLVPAAVAGVLVIALAWPLARTYSKARLGDRDAATVAYYSATTADYFRAHPRSALWAERTLAGRQPERALFPGAMLLLLAAVALVPPIGRTRVIYATAALVAFEMSRGFNSLVYPLLYEALPFIRGLRVPARSSILVGMALAVLAGFGVRRLLDGRSRATTALALTAIVVAIGIDLRPALVLEPVWRVPPPIYGPITGDTRAVLAEFPIGGESRRYTANVPSMYFSVWHWSNMVSGYSGHLPPGQVEFEASLRTFPDAGTIEILRARGVTHVSIVCALFGGGCDPFLQRVDAMRELQLISSGRWEGQPARLYELGR
jgi:hypothetical protein